ncbi:MAG: hypothetical protein ABEH35_01835 [Haloarculaceae archaeon]
MSHKMEAVAVMLVLVGLLLFNTMETAVVGGLLVAGGAYALVLPRLVDPGGPATTR